MKKNKISSVLFSIGIIEMIACFMVGLVFGQPDRANGGDFNFSIALYWWIGGFVSGMLFIGFSELLNLVQKIYNIMGKNSVVSPINSYNDETAINEDLGENSVFGDDGVTYHKIKYYKNDSFISIGSLIFNSHSILFTNNSIKIFELSIFQIRDCKLINAGTDSVLIEILQEKFFNKEEKIGLSKNEDSSKTIDEIYKKIVSMIN